jgi:copper chaperone CopZ
VGKSALEGLKGIKEVKRGFRGFREINTVIYDPSIITTAEMVSALKAAGIYRGQLEE